MTSTRVLGAIAAGTLLFSACGGGSTTDSAADSTAAPDPTTVAIESQPGVADAPVDDAVSTDGGAPADAAPAALQFTAPLVGGGELDASTLAGKPTVFWFWAPT